MKPIREFKSEEEFQTTAKKLQHKLFLDEWSIVFVKTDKPIKLSNGNFASGLCSYDYCNRAANITILNKNSWSDCEEAKDDTPITTTNCALLNLIHELLHLRREYIVPSDVLGDEADTLSEFERLEVHVNLEKMAKSIFMLITGVDTDFFLK